MNRFRTKSCLDRPAGRGIAFFVLLLCLVALHGLTGCGKPVPKTLALSPPQEKEAKELLRRFQGREQPSILDADMRLGWEAWGSKGSSAATLQMQRPARLRFSVNDPLGRPLLILVSDGRAFTLVDNQAALAYQGRTDSAFWHEYLPETLRPEDLFYLLGGRLTQAPVEDAQTGLDQAGKGFWYTWIDRQRQEHYVLLNRSSGRMDKRLLFDRKGGLALDISYSNYLLIPDSGFSWPGHLLVKGEGIRGTLSLQVERFYPQQDFPPTIFFLSIPSHFSTEEVR